MRRRWMVWLLVSAPLAAQETPLLTAVYAIADAHTTRRTTDRDPLSKIAGVCQIIPAAPLPALSCASEPLREERTGRRYFCSIVLLRDLNEELFLAACASPARESLCGELRAGQTFPAEADSLSVRLVAEGRQLPLRLLERRPRPASIDSPSLGTPSQVKPSAGTPSAVPFSNVAPSLGTPSTARASEAPSTTGTPSALSPALTSLVPASASRLYLEASTAPANVYVDGQLVGFAPVALPLTPGRHTIRVEARGYEAWTDTVRLAPGELLRLRAEPTLP